VLAAALVLGAASAPAAAMPVPPGSAEKLGIHTTGSADRLGFVWFTDSRANMMSMVAPAVG
jgi:hypothetical protein